MNLEVHDILAQLPGHVEEKLRFEFLALPQGWGALAALAGLAVMVWAVIWMYRHEGRAGASLRRRLILAGVRATVMLALAAIWFEPVMARYLHRWIDSYTLVLADTSASMDLADTYRDTVAGERAARALSVNTMSPTRRQDVLAAVLESADRAFLRKLAAHNRVRVYTFDETPQLQYTIRADAEQPAKPAKPGADANGADTPINVDLAATRFAAQGPATNIERAVRRALEAAAGAPIAAIVVISDGGFNQGASAEATARLAADRSVPIYAVGVGDPSPPQNARVADVSAPKSAFTNDPFAITTRLAIEGVRDVTLRVNLRERRDGDGGGEGGEGGDDRIIESRDVPLAAPGVTPPITFELRRPSVGRYLYTVETPILDFESVADDNARQVAVNVIDARIRVLLVAGGPSWEYRFLYRLLERDPTFNVSCWLQSADAAAVRDGNTAIDHLPAAVEELFEYDVVIMLDPDPSEITEDWCRNVDRLVSEHGGGLLYAAARPFSPALVHVPDVKPLLDILPVTLDPEADLILNRIGHYQVRPAPLEIPPASADHPILRLGDDATSTRSAWQQAGEVYWHYPVLREKPVATVLMRHGDPRMQNAYGAHVLAAVQFVGAGRTAFLGFDHTWRWRKVEGGEERYDRFWVQMTRYLAEGKLLGGRRRGTLLTDADEFPLGEAVAVSARLYDARFEPLTQDQVVARYAVEDDVRDVTLKRRIDQPGWYEGRFVPHRTGVYRISLAVPGGGGPGRSAGSEEEIVHEVRVTRPDIEVIHPQMDRGQLSALARLSDGGEYFEVDEAMLIPPLIPDRHEVTTTRSRPIILWDRWWMLAALVALLSFEWAVRKWSRLL